jgi:hypothetical protein
MEKQQKAITGTRWKFFFGVGLGFELKAWYLQSRYSTALAIPPVRFALVILEMGSPERFSQAGLKRRYS